MTSHRKRGALGQSLVETLAVVALLGATVVAFAPFHVFLLRGLRGDDARPEPAALGSTARLLAGDARAALDTRVESPSAVLFTLNGVRRVTWRVTPVGALERVELTAGRERRKVFAETSLHVGLSAENRLAATLGKAGNRDLEIEVWLRHGRRSR